MFIDAEPINAIAAPGGSDFLPRRLGTKGTEIAVSVRVTLAVTVDAVVEVSYYDAETGGSSLGLGSLNDGNALAAGRLYAFEVDVAKGQFVNLRASVPTTVVGAMTTLGQP